MIHTTTDAQLADSLIREHRECEIVDYESNIVFCYNCNVGVEWVG